MLQGLYGSMRQLLQVHNQVVVNGFAQNSPLLHKLVSRCVDLGDLSHARLAFENAKEPSLTVWNQMLRGMSKSSLPSEAVLLYIRLSRSGGIARPNGYTFSFVLNACSRCTLSMVGHQVHGQVITTGFASSTFVQTSLIDMYSRSSWGDCTGGLLVAQKVFDEMPHKNVEAWNSMLAAHVRLGNTIMALTLFDEIFDKDVFSWTTMITGCAQAGWSKKAIVLFYRMQVAGLEADQVTLTATLSACAVLGDLELGRQIHVRSMNAVLIDRQRRGRLVSLDNSLINMYTKCGEIEDALRVFESMPHRTTESWTTLIMGLATHGRGADALCLFHQMLGRTACSRHGSSERPDGFTYVAVLCASSGTGRIQEGRYYFDQMTRVFRIQPSIQHYCCLVDMMSRAGNLEDAVSLIESMPMEPNGAVWGALLSGCRLHGDVKLAGQAATKLLELAPHDHSSRTVDGHLALLSSLHTSAGRWDDASWFRDRMADRGAGKPLAKSWVVAHGAVHEFSAGDRKKQCDLVVFKGVTRDDKARQSSRLGTRPLACGPRHIG